MATPLYPLSLSSRPGEAQWAEYLDSLIEWQNFAINLPGIRQNHVDKIEALTKAETTGKLHRQKMALWTKWTSVYPSGTWDDVVAALKKVEKITLAEEIKEKLKNEEERSHAVQILSSFEDDIIKSDFNPVALATILNKENILSDEKLAVIKDAKGSDVETHTILFSFVKAAVNNKHTNLYAYGSVLHEFFNKKLGKDILHDYEKHIHSSGDFCLKKIQDKEYSQSPKAEKDCQQSLSKNGESSFNVEVPVDKSGFFRAVRIAFGAMHQEVCKVIMQSPHDLESMKEFVMYCGMKKVLADDVKGILDHIMHEECTLIDVQFLRQFLKKFGISAAEIHAIKYEEYIEKQCKDLSISLCLNEKLGASKSLPLLTYSTIVYVFDWEPDKKCGLTLEDVTDILSKASGKLVKLKHINSKFSVAVVCSFSYSQTGLVIAMNQKNLDFLIRKGLKELTVGYCTIWKKEENEKHQYDFPIANKSSHDVKNNAEEVVKPQSEFLGTEEDANDILEQELSENNEENRAEFEEKDESVMSKKEQKGKNQSTQEAPPKKPIGEDTATEAAPKTWRHYERASKEMMIIGSFGSHENWPIKQQVTVLSKLIPDSLEGSYDEWMKEEVEGIVKIYEKDPKNYDIKIICIDFPGMERSREHYIKSITYFLKNCEKSEALIFYTGHGEKDTGNWCFKDGVITFDDIFNIYIKHFRGKSLQIISDCSYSGNWIKGCIKKLDECGILSCGHHTREQGILLKIFTSCQPNEEATLLTYCRHGIRYSEEDKGVLLKFDERIKLEQAQKGQNPMYIDFRHIYCYKLPEDQCELDSTCTWEDRLGNKREQIFQVLNEDHWCYVLVDKEKIDEFKAKNATGNIEVGEAATYGEVLHSGSGSVNVEERLKLRFNNDAYALSR